MAKAKRPMLQQRSASSRAGDRATVAIAGTCKVGDRPEEDVLITDLSPSGCRMRAGAVGVTKSEPLVLRIGLAAPIAARLEWAKGGALGVSFDTPLAEDLVERLCAASVPQDNIVPLRRKPAP